MYTFTDPARSTPKQSNVQTKEFSSEAFLSFLSDLLSEIDPEVAKDSQMAKVTKEKNVSKAVAPRPQQVIYFNIINLIN